MVHATGSTGTQAGLVAGLQGVNAQLPVLGISVRQPYEVQVAAVHALVEKTAAFLGTPEVGLEAVGVNADYVGSGCKIFTPFENHCYGQCRLPPTPPLLT